MATHRSSMKRPRHSRRVRNRKYNLKFAAAMNTKFSGQETEITVDTVGSDVLALAATPPFFGPFVFHGVPPVTLRGDRYWMAVDGSDNATVYGSLADLQANRPMLVPSWDLSPDCKTLDDGVTAVVAAADVDATANTFTSTDHGFVTGDAVRATTSGALPTGGPAANTTYYVVKIDDDVFKLSDTEAHALAGTDFVDPSDQGSGDHTFTLIRVDLTADVETFRVDDHGMETGDGPLRLTTSGALPTGVSAGTDYWVIRHDADRFALASSYANAIAGTRINLTAIGSGTHQIVRAVTIGVDLSAQGIVKWLAQGVKREVMLDSAAADADTIFI